MKTIKVTRDGRPATAAELEAAVAGKPLPPVIMNLQDSAWKLKEYLQSPACAANGFDVPDGIWLPFVDAVDSPRGCSDLNELSKIVHAANIGWWKDINTGQPLARNKGELLALIHSEISEALEGERKNLMDDKLPHRPMAEVELADAIIRILDYAAGFGYDLQGAFDEKMRYNSQREDHKHEKRQAAGGKKW